VANVQEVIGTVVGGKGATEIIEGQRRVEVVVRSRKSGATALRPSATSW
jgi:Cu/Ag efflux pump CusA